MAIPPEAISKRAMAPSTAAFRFLSLPLELRLKIYKELLYPGPRVQRYQRDEDEDDEHARNAQFKPGYKSSKIEYRVYVEDDESDRCTLCRQECRT